MRKFIAILFIVIFPVVSMAHMGHYNKYNKIEMEIFRNGELIGYNYYFFERNGEETIITNQFKFSVDLLGATIFQVESYGEEKYIKDQLISFNSKTLQNDKEKFVNLELNYVDDAYIFDDVANATVFDGVYNSGFNMRFDLKKNGALIDTAIFETNVV